MEEIYATMSKEAYRVGRQRNVGDFEVDSRFTDDNSTVYFNPKTKQAAIAFRGTNPKKGSDLGADALIGLGLTRFSNRFKRAHEKTEAVMKHYGDSVVLTGHSLGGTQSLSAAKKHGLEAHAFNPGFSPIAPTKVSKRSKVYHVVGDPISSAVSYGWKSLKKNFKWRKPKGSDPHAIGNFIHKDITRPSLGIMKPPPRTLPLQYV